MVEWLCQISPLNKDHTKVHCSMDSGTQQTHSHRTSKYERRHEKTNVLVSDLVRHKPGCAASEDG